MKLELVATATFGLEAVVRREIEALGYKIIKTEDGRVTYMGDERAIVRSNLWLRCADRVYVRMGGFKATDFEKLAKEQERQAEQLAKHEEQIAKLEHRMSVAEGEIDFQMEQIERLREHIEHAEIERDGCVFGSSNYFKWDKKVMTLEKQIHTAEKKISDAQFAKESAQKKLEVA